MNGSTSTAGDEPNQLRQLQKSTKVDQLTRISEDSIFSDAFWKMRSVVTLPGIKESRKQWDFSQSPGFPGGFALGMAEFAFSRIFGEDDEKNLSISWLTVHNELTCLNTFAEFATRAGYYNFDQLNPEVFVRFLRDLQFGNLGGTGQRSDERILQIFRTLNQFWKCSSGITHCMPVNPLGWKLAKTFKNGLPDRLNRTPVIPEAIFAALMKNSLDYVLEHSVIVIGAWKMLESFWSGEATSEKFNKRTSLKRLSAYSKEVAKTMPADWLKNGWTSLGDIYAELYQLRAACIAVILAFSGIRVSELLGIEAGCYQHDVCGDGSLRAYISTKVHKHRKGGAKDTWVVIDEVVKAIQILESLTWKMRISTGDQRLLATAGKNNFFNVQTLFFDIKLDELTSEAIVLQLNYFRRHCNNRVLSSKIPLHVGDNGEEKDWELNCRQFRQTLARHIARQPFGIIAGMLQYKHVGAAIFEGYAGSEPEWNKLLEEENVLASVDILGEIAIDMSSGQVAGGMGGELTRQFELEFKGRAEDFSPSQIAKWLADTHKPLFVGKFNFCFFDAGKARCTNSTASAPVLNFCQPEQCENACVGRRHINKWDAQLSQAEELARHAKIPVLHRKLMEDEIDKLRAVVMKFHH